jgi:hypothetical protein
MIAAPEIRKSPVSGSLGTGFFRKVSQPCSNFAQASVVDAAYVSSGSGGCKPLTIVGA